MKSGEPPAGRSLFQPTQVSSLRDLAYDALREAILDGSLSPGQRVKERDIASQMHISTTPVKEALRRLEQDGLIISHPRRGAVVSSSALTSVEEILEIRAYLEGLAARLAATKISASELLALDDQVRQMAELTQAMDLEKLFNANTQFHHMVREASGNHFITQFVCLLTPFDRSVRKQALSYPDEAQRGLEEHTQVYSALKKHDGTAAEVLMRNHILRTVKFVIEQAEGNQALHEAG
jgi:DNA-binding GntR family transcriptional regulator